jgi:hypothetical protein
MLNPCNKPQPIVDYCGNNEDDTQTICKKELGEV